MPNKQKTVSPGDALYVLMLANGMDEKTLGTTTKENPAVIKSIIEGKKEISINLAVKLTSIFKTNPSFWINIHSTHEQPKPRGRKPGKKANTTTKKPKTPKKTKVESKPRVKKPRTQKEEKIPETPKVEA